MNNNPTLNNNVQSWRILVFGAILGLAFLVYVGRLFNLQILHGQEWVALAEENRISEINLPAQRGII